MRRSEIRLATWFGCVFCLLSSTLGATTVRLPEGIYDVTAQTVLPHLEEALRYATTRTRDCLHVQEVTDMFPILRHQAFAGCSLHGLDDSADGLEFRLVCVNPEAASGLASVSIAPTGFTAQLHIKMGGKNMTLAQRLTGVRVGACSPNP